MKLTQKEYKNNWVNSHKGCWVKYNRNYRQKLRMIILVHYSGDPPKCACCGETHIEFLTIDHINGGGTKHRKRVANGGGTNFYSWIIKNNFPDGFQILCMNCNCAKGFYGRCPHEN